MMRGGTATPYGQPMRRPEAIVIAEVALVAALAGSALWQVWSWSPADVEGGRTAHAVLAAAVTLPLLARRRHATLVLVVVVVAAVVQYELGGGLGQPFFAVALALYSIGAHAATPQTFLGPAVLLLQVLALDVPRLRRGDPVDEVVPAWFVLAGLWGFGRWIRHRRGESAALAHRARAAEEGAAARAAQAVSDEQARIGRELHDLVAHSMGVIVIQAQGAQRALDHDPARARSALSAIESTGRSGLAELRRLLVHLQVEGDVRPLPAGLELCAYRVVQESLTNILKHAGPATADVLLGYLPDVLDITVRDSGARPDPDSPPGHGLVGMRQRVLLYGGTLDVGAAPGGGFAIHARLPLEGEQP
jgi:signal transduction histidine kinase